MNRVDTLRTLAVMLSSNAMYGCTMSAEPGEAPPGGVAAAVAALTGDHLPGVSDSDFEEAKQAFAAQEGADDGLGPIFNANGCGNCHSQGALGGASEATERRFGRLADGRFDPLTSRGGSLRQLQSLGQWVNAAGQACDVPFETEPSEASVREVGRLSTPLFGLGLVDAMPDAFFRDLAASQPRSVRGSVNSVSVLLPDPRDSSQRVGGRRVGRFGWKADVPSLVQFAADAYVNEMGITTQHCIGGQSIMTFAGEPTPNGVAVPVECEDNIPGVDDAVGPCTNSLTEIQEDVELFARFMTFLAPPESLLTGGERDALAAAESETQSESASAERTAGDRDIGSPGASLFDRVGCDDCHVRRAFTTPRRPHNGVPANFRFFPFSDFLLHDMGALGDQIGAAGDSQARTRSMRTAPLWGIRFRTKLLHDGRASTVEQAVQAHSGQGSAAASEFMRLSAQDRQTLVQFVAKL